MTTVGEALTEGAAALSEAGIENPRNEARLLLGSVLALTPAQVFARTDARVGTDELKAYYERLSGRCRGKPLAHITGMREFWSLAFAVSPATLIPRPDTETLIELAEEIYAGRPSPSSVLDLGTGSGCILLALLSCFADATGVGVDVSAEACRIAQENAESLGLQGRVEIREASWTDGIDERFDLIVSNPPYIPSADIAKLDRDVRDHEPLAALDGGQDGLDAYRSLMPLAATALADDGVVIVEAGIGQADDIARIAARAGLDETGRRCDIAGTQRAISFCKKGVGITGATG